MAAAGWAGGGALPREPQLAHRVSLTSTADGPIVSWAHSLFGGTFWHLVLTPLTLGTVAPTFGSKQTLVPLGVLSVLPYLGTSCSALGFGLANS